jgi:hypothetical protein
VATQEEIVSGTMTYTRLGVALVKEKLVQHRLRWFGHIQQRPAEAPVCSGVIRRTGNDRRGRGRPNLTWPHGRSITKELALDRRVKTSNSCDRTLTFCSFSFIAFCQSFFSFYSPIFNSFSFIVFSPFSV